MPFLPVILPTDLLLWLLIAAVTFYGWYCSRKPHLAAPWGRVFRSRAAVVSCVVLAAYVAGVAPLVRGIEAAGAVAWRRIGPVSRRFLPASTPARAFGLGLVFGWLPCGMVYVALIAALATAHPLHGALVMAAFGLGTLPNLLAISAWFRYAATWARGRVARVLAAAAIAAVGFVGLAKAVEPAMVSADGSWCLTVPGITAIFGGH